MALTEEQKKKITKINTSILIIKIQNGRIEDEEELEFAMQLLKKRRIDTDSVFAKKNSHPMDEVVGPLIEEALVLDDPSIDPSISKVESIIIEKQTIENTKDPLIEEEPLTPVKKEKKAKTAKKTGKREKKIYIDEKGKEMTKSDLMRRLIRLKHSIKPKELNEQLVDAGFDKAYHSEIQRCRQQMGVIPEVKE